MGSTHYQGVHAKVEQRFSHGLAYLVSYTRSNLRDDASSVFDASIFTGPVANYPVADSFNRRLERDDSTGDIPHCPRGVGRVGGIPVRQGEAHPPRRAPGALVNDWTVTGLLTLQFRMPVAVTQATNTNAFAGFGTQRAEPNRDPALAADEACQESRWFDTSAFTAAPMFTLEAVRAIPCGGPATATSI